jgi:hypothetical protein
MGESVTLLNVRQFHCVIPHWNDSVVQQALGRVIRTRSHSTLPEEDRVVKVYRHLAMLPDGTIPLSDQIDVKKSVVSEAKKNTIEEVEGLLAKCSIESMTSKELLAEDCDVSSFCDHYLHIYLDSYVSEILSHLGKHITTIGKLHEACRLPLNLVLAVVSHIITNNVIVRDYYGRKCYLRHYNGALSLCRDPSSSLENYDSSAGHLFSKHTVSNGSLLNVDETLFDVESKSSIQQILFELFKLKWSERVQILERSIELSSVISTYILHRSVVRIRDQVYHIYNYRKPIKGSYKTSARGIKAKALTRKLTKKGWVYVASDEERSVLRYYEKCAGEIEEQFSRFGLYAVVSTVDLGTRIRDVSGDYGMGDSRNIHRGRSINSIDPESIDRYLRALGEEPGYVMSSKDKSELLINLLMKMKLVDII